MIDLTPLEVRKKKGDFRRTMRGYDPALVDDFLDLVADRLEELVRENMALLERVGRQEDQVRDYRDRERALTEALVSAQEMREEVRKQATREAELATRTAEQQAEQIRASAEAEVRQIRSSGQQQVLEELANLKQERHREEQVVRELRARREQLLGNYRAFLEQELEELDVIARAAGPANWKAPSRTRAAEPSRRAAAPAKPPVEDVVVEDDVLVDDDVLHEDDVLAADGVLVDDDVLATDGVLVDDDVPGGDGVPVDEDVPGGDDVLLEDDVAAESALAQGADPADAADPEEEPFAPEPFVEDEADAVAEAYETESGIPVEGVAEGSVDETEVGGGGTEERLYDGIAPDEAGDGVPGPIGLGSPEPWEDAAEWSLPDLQLIEEAGDGETIDLGDDDEHDEEMQQLLRNAAAAGYDLEDDAVPEELLLDEAVSEDDDDTEPPPDGWLPTLLEDDK